MKINKELITKKMKEKKMTYKYFSEIFNMDESNISRKFNGNRKMSLEEGLIIAKTLDIDPFDIILDWNK